MHLRARWGADKGKLLAAEVEVIADGGAYIYFHQSVRQRNFNNVHGTTEIPNVNVDSYAVYTNNLPNGAFRDLEDTGAFAAEPDEPAGRDT
jgi:CO/xanthine dehydrogenase Mo-binding subunit